jgi:hypothetical protein
MPARPPAPAPPPPPAPSAAEPSEPERDEDRGILLPGIFDRVPGEPAGEYRLVREPLVPSSGRPFYRHVGHEPGARETVLVAPLREETVRVRTDVPLATVPPHREKERAQQQQQPALPIRLIGVAGFMIGVGLATTYWVLTRVPEMSGVPSSRVTKFAQPPAETAAPLEAPSPAAAAPEPAEPPAPEPARPVPAPAPTPAAAPHARVAVSINATPWAIVRVDGREIGETPLAGIELEPGPHVFEARMPDGTTREQTVEVSADRVTVVFE